MHEPISLRRSTFFQLIDSLTYPNPDDPNEPHGPIGPIARRLESVLDRVALNPQPLPPRYFAAAARQVIGGLVDQLRQAEIISPDRFDASAAAFRDQLRDVVDDWCGTRPGRWPWPPRPHRELSGEELIVASAQFGRVAAALTNNPVQRDVSAAAEQLLETGIRRIENPNLAAAGSIG